MVFIHVQENAGTCETGGEFGAKLVASGAPIDKKLMRECSDDEGVCRQDTGQSWRVPTHGRE